MSYNITKFKVKKIKDLKIPVASLYKHPRTDKHPDCTFSPYQFHFKGLGFELSGIIKNGMIIVASIECIGEFSYYAMDWILEPAFKDSKGELVAVCIWEGGDSINKLIVKDGKVTWEDVEI